MTVAELIAQLQQMPQDLEVWTVDDEYGDRPIQPFQLGLLYDYINGPHAGQVAQPNPQPCPLPASWRNPRPIVCLEATQ